jgi:hypothetical protein
VAGEQRMLARYLMLSSAIMGFLLPAIPALARDVTLNQNSSNQSSSAEGPKKSPDSSKEESDTRGSRFADSTIIDIR